MLSPPGWLSIRTFSISMKIDKRTKPLPFLNFRKLYDAFDAPVVEGVDCGTFCAPHNPTGKPFCCDICQAVPAAYHSEWRYLRENTDLWREWTPDACETEQRLSPSEADDLRAGTPQTMRLIVCKGPQACQRPFRALSCRQFPFFPFVTGDWRFIGLAYEWEFEPVCWVISSLSRVSEQYRLEFVAAFDMLFSQWPDEMESYAARSEAMRERFAAQHRRIPILHRRGGWYLLSPKSGRMSRVAPERLPRFGPYRSV